MTRKTKKVATMPESSSGDRKKRGNITGIPAKQNSMEHGNLKANVLETKGLEMKNTELKVGTKPVEADKQEMDELKNGDFAGNLSNDEEDDDLDEFDQTGDDSNDANEEEDSGDEKEENSSNSDDDSSESATDEEHDDVSSDERNGNLQSNDSGNGINGIELENVPGTKTIKNQSSIVEEKHRKITNELNEIHVKKNENGDHRTQNSGHETLKFESKNLPPSMVKQSQSIKGKEKATNPSNDLTEGLAGGSTIGKVRNRESGGLRTRAELKNNAGNTTKVFQPSTSRNNNGKAPISHLKPHVGNHGGKVNANVRPYDSDDLRPRSELENNNHSTMKLSQPSMAKENSNKATIDRPKTPVGNNGEQNAGTAKNATKNTTIVAETHRRPTGKMIQCPSSGKTAIISKNEISRNPDDHKTVQNAVSNLGNEEDAIEEGCDVDPSDEETTILDVFDALGINDKQTEKNLVQTGSKLLPVLAKTANPTPEAKKSFAQLFKSENAKKMGYKLQYVCNEELDGDLKFEDEDVGETSKVWGHSLIGYIAGKNPSYNAVIGYCKAWTHKCRVHFDSSGWIVVKFEEEEELKKVLEGGPYLIYGKPFMIKKMPKYFCFDKSEICKAQVWVNLPHLPLELWNEKALSKIGSRIGEPIQVDSITATMERASFARILVEVDLSKNLIDDIPLVLPNGKRIVQEVHYEYVPTYCEDCKVIGHDTKMCARRRKQLEDAKTKEQKKDLVGATAGNALKPKATSSESVSLEVSTIPTFDASSSKPSKDFSLEKIDEDIEDGFVKYLSKNQKKALVRGKKQMGKEHLFDIEVIGAGINKAASRWQKKSVGPCVEVPKEARPIGEREIMPISSGSCIETGSILCVKKPEGEGTVMRESTTLVVHDQGKKGVIPRPFR